MKGNSDDAFNHYRGEMNDEDWKIHCELCEDLEDDIEVSCAADQVEGIFRRFRSAPYMQGAPLSDVIALTRLTLESLAANRATREPKA